MFNNDIQTDGLYSMNVTKWNISQRYLLFTACNLIYDRAERSKPNDTYFANIKEDQWYDPNDMC